MHSSKCLLFYCTLCSLSFSPFTYASDFSIALTERVQLSDNIALSATSPQSDMILNTGIVLRYINDSKKYPTTIEASASFRDYIDDSFGDRNDYYANVVSRWVASRERFAWDLVDRYRINTINSLAPVTPGNQENTNYFSTGPEISLIKTRRSLLSLGFRYEDFFFEKSIIDREDYVARLNWLYKLSKVTEIGVNGAYRQANFKNESLNENYDRSDYFVSMLRTGPSYSLRFELGETAVIPVASAQIDNAIVRVDYKQAFSQNSDVGLIYKREISDFSTLAAIVDSGFTFTTNATNQLFLLEEIAGRYEQRIGWGSVELRYTSRDYDYQINALDRKLDLFNVTLNMVADASMNFQLNYQYLSENWPSINREDEEDRMTARVTKEFTNVFTGGFTYQYINRTSNRFESNYEENRAILDLIYKIR